MSTADFEILLSEHCRHEQQALSDEQIDDYLHILNNWTYMRQTDLPQKIVKTFSFQNYYETLAFINAIAFIFHQEDHHPDINFSYNRCTITLHTHSVNNNRGGLSKNDFICAAKLDALLK